jgi:hypothetical protein
MKGGKAGRPRKSSANAAKRPAGRDKPTKTSAKRTEDAPPKKGSRKKSHGGMSSSGDE